MRLGSPIEDVEGCLKQIDEDWRKGRFNPILESDIAGHLYHVLASRVGSAACLHLSTRLCGDPENEHRKYDLVVGEVTDGVGESRPYIKEPTMIVEIKLLARGFNPAQKQRRLRGIKEDIQKLAKIPNPEGGRFVLAFEYLNARKCDGCLTRLCGTRKRRGSWRTTNGVKVICVWMWHDGEELGVDWEYV